MRSDMAHVKGITQVYLHIYPRMEQTCLYSLRIHQIAPQEQGSAHPITGHYSLIDLKRMKG